MMNLAVQVAGAADWSDKRDLARYLDAHPLDPHEMP